MNILQKYIWIIDTLKNQRLSLEKLSERFSNSVDLDVYGDGLSRQTFYRWRKDIADMFGIEIECEKGGENRYYITNPEVLDNKGLTQWLLNTYSTLNSLENSIKVKHRILTEPIPSSEQCLNDVIEAMKENRIIRFTYTKFGSVEGSSYSVRPYCVKLFMQRWYLLGYCEERSDLRTYGLDRISNLSITDVKFEMPEDFDAEFFYATHYGIESKKDIQCETIVFRAWEPHNHYLRSLPIHHSQQELESAEGYTDFQVRLRPNYEFYWKLLSMGNYIQILSPQSVRQEMANMIKKVLEGYKGC